MVYRATEEYHVDYPYNIGHYWHPNRRSYSHWARIIPNANSESAGSWILRFYWSAGQRWVGSRSGQNTAAAYATVEAHGNVWLEWKTFNQVQYGQGTSTLYTHNIDNYYRGPSGSSDPAMHGAIYMAKLASSTFPADYKPMQRFKVRWGCHRYSSSGNYGCGVPMTSSG
jgi:hypothetical protein